MPLSASHTFEHTLQVGVGGVGGLIVLTRSETFLPIPGTPEMLFPFYFFSFLRVLKQLKDIVRQHPNISPDTFSSTVREMTRRVSRYGRTSSTFVLSGLDSLNALKS